MGAVPASMQLQGMSVVFSRTPAQQTGLDQLTTAQQNPKSPLYHRWLTPKEFAAQFGAADADVATVQTWLESQGFTVSSVAAGRNRISFSGTAGSVARAFGTTLHYYTSASDGSTHFAPLGEVSIPAALAPAVLTVSNLSNYRPHAANIGRTVQLQPQYTSDGQFVYLTPLDVATIYDVNPVYGSGYNGAGQTIAVLGESAVLPEDLSNFQTALGVPVDPQSLNLVPGTGPSEVVPGDELEGDLDLEYSSAMAPGASVAYYYSGSGGDVFSALEYVVDNDLAPVISISYALCEPSADTFYFQYMDETMEQAASQGQTIVVAAGDDGSVSCEEGGVDSSQEFVPAVNYPASSPWVVGMGGTAFPPADVSSDPVNSTYWQSSGGVLVSSALSYIPETVWNDYGQGSSSGGGGVSMFEPLPAWQSGVPGIPGGNFRFVPDISMAASAAYPGYLVCSSDGEFEAPNPCQNGFVGVPYGIEIVGGTSVDAPMFAGMVAVLNQAKGYSGGQGLINPELYSLASNAATYASAFHDITAGGNNCSDIANCGTGPQNTEYMAGVGYDEASGLGSIDFANLMAAWPQSTNGTTASTTTALSISPTNAVYGTAVTFTATVSNGGTGSVAFYDGASFLGTAPVNGAGVATYTNSTIEGGSNSITATYGGATGYAASTSAAAEMNVSAAPTAVVMTASPTSAAYGSTVTFTSTVTSSGVPVEFAAVYYQVVGAGGGFSQTSTDSNGVATATYSLLPSGTSPVIAIVVGTPDYAASTSAPSNITMSEPPTTTVLSASPGSTSFGSSVTLSALVTASGSPVSSGGNVVFANGGTTVGVAPVGADGVAAVTLSNLPVGTNSMIASYSAVAGLQGSSSAPVAVTVVAASTATVLTSSASSVNYGASVTLTAAVTANGAPEAIGSVAFWNGSVVLGTSAPNSSGVASMTVSALGVGSDTMTAGYTGTYDATASMSTPVVVSVAADPSATSIAASNVAPSYGAGVTFTATVSANGVPATSGVVTLLSDGAPVGTGTLNGSGAAAITISTLPVGTDTMTASYGGSATTAASVSGALAVAVSPVTAPTTTVVTASPSDATLGAAVTFSATVTVEGAPAASGGLVTFLNSSGVSIGEGELDGGGTAAVSTSSLPVGANSITASYGGGAGLAGSVSNPVTVTVAPAVTASSTTTVMSASSTTAVYGSSVILSAVVSSGGAPVTDGEVSFENGSTWLGTATLNASGVASVMTSGLAPGTDSIVASYTGATELTSSVSAAITVTVTEATSPTAPVTISVPAPPPVAAGGEVQTAVSLMAGASYSGTMNLSCTLTNAPVGAHYLPACSLNPAKITVAASGTAATTLTVQTTSATSAAMGRRLRWNPWRLGGGSAMAGLLLLVMPTRRKRLFSVLALLLVVIAAGPIGCGARNEPGTTGTTQSTTAGSYTFAVQGTDASNPSTTVSASVTITVD
ncbi:MAG: Ig-like domain repeat protein [Acidobacteriaceae bacterium]